MSFDGLSKPSQLHAYSDPLSPYLGATRAASEAAKKPRIDKSKASYRDSAVDEHASDYLQEEREDKDGLLPEEYEQMMMLAKLRGVMNLSFEEGVLYYFHFNETTGLVELINDRDNRVMLTLTPEELLQVSQRMQRYAGRMTDQSA